MRKGEDDPLPLPSPPPLREEFEELRPVGRGGMGIVYEARQKSFNRRVALKFLPPQAALDERCRNRFLREATAASMLDHGNIVPVFGIEISGPTPYYAMKFITGHSLAEIIRDLRHRTKGQGAEVSDDASSQLTSVAELVARLGRDEFGSGSRPSVRIAPDQTGNPIHLGRPYLDAVARLGMQAAMALSHAHANGVTHGDVKPANLLLDPGGHLWLTDFGLAILKDQDATRVNGIACGTPGYMSPEQSSPLMLPIDHRTDLYSLGVTLYELLTLHRPLQISDPLSGQSSPPPRRLNPSVPRDLETIVLKAMEPEVSDRYATADELAEDLGRYLRQESIHARRASVGDRASKWAMRNRKVLSLWASTISLVLLTMIGFLAVANRREAAQRRRAEVSLVTLRDLFRDTTLAAEDLTEAVPLGSDRLHGYYGRMQRFYEQAIGRIPEAGRDPEFRYRAALASFHFAQSFSGRESGTMKETLRYLDRSIELLRPLVRDHPTKASYRYDLFRSLSRRAGIFSPMSDKLHHAEADARESLQVIEVLAKDNPENPDWEDAVAFQNFILSNILLVRGRPEDATRHARSCLAIAKRLVEAFPAKPMYLANVYRAWSELAAIARRAGRKGDEEAALREAIRAHEILVRDGPDQTHYPIEHLSLQGSLGVLLREVGRYAEALHLLEEAFATAERLLRAYPYRSDYLTWAFTLRGELATLHHLEGRVEMAETMRQDGMREVEKVIAARPEFSFLRDGLRAPPPDTKVGPPRDDRP
ncbi:serine/threonine-protein kinase [Isosphaeraceae bacterium EP7]